MDALSTPISTTTRAVMPLATRCDCAMRSTNVSWQERREGQERRVQCRPMAKAEKIAVWMRSQLSAAGARGFVAGLSGGGDSGLGARLAAMGGPGAGTGGLAPGYRHAQ